MSRRAAQLVARAKLAATARTPVRHLELPGRVRRAACTCCAQVRPDIPVLFLDTLHHFAETLRYRDEIAAALGAQPGQPAGGGAAVGLWQTSTQACCARHKVGPLFAALEDYDTWFTGLRREQSPSRADLQEVEPFTLPSGTACCARSARSRAGRRTTCGATRRRTTSRCCRSTSSATRASAASRARRCRSIPATSDRAAGRARSSSAASTSRRRDSRAVTTGPTLTSVQGRSDI